MKPQSWATRFRIWIWKKRYLVWIRFRTRDRFPAEMYRQCAEEGWNITLDDAGSIEAALAVHPLQAVNDELQYWSD